MNWAAISFDWNQVRAFLATVDTGSLSAAARALGLTQPTLSRQVAALEDDLKMVLFDRVGRSLVPTKIGLELAEHARSMADGAASLSLAAAGREREMDGQVCITATDAMCAYMLPGMLARLKEIAPGIVVEILAVNDVRDLRRREADIAIRGVRPDQPDLIARRMPDVAAYLYGASAYLDRIGRPEKPADIAGAADFIGYNNPDELRATLVMLGFPADRIRIRHSSANAVVVWELVRQGLGLSLMVSEVADRWPGIERVLPSQPPLTFEMWLTTHRELHTSRRIRLVFDFLAEELGALGRSREPGGT
jgi:DNA-binding transcriptional LysR family regulator